MEDIFGKSSIISLAGGHIGPPLQRRENLLNKDVGEHLCVLPHKIVGTIILKMILKTGFLQCNHVMSISISTSLSVSSQPFATNLKGVKVLSIMK